MNSSIIWSRSASSKGSRQEGFLSISARLASASFFLGFQNIALWTLLLRGQQLMTMFIKPTGEFSSLLGIQRLNPALYLFQTHNQSQPNLSAGKPEVKMYLAIWIL